MRFVLRDDDTSYFTTPEELQKAYDFIWHRVPVSLAVIPNASDLFYIFSKNSNLFGNFEKQLKLLREMGEAKVRSLSGSTHSLLENQELVQFLRTMQASQKIEILLHGYDHNIGYAGYEFESAQDFSWKIIAGKKLLTDALGTTVTVFVPPNNRISRIAVRAIAGHQLNLLSTNHPSWRTRPVWLLDRRTILALAAHECKRIFGRCRVFYPHILNYTIGLKEFICLPLDADEGLLQNQLQYAFKTGGEFCLYTHYYAIAEDDSKKKKLTRIVEYARGLGEVEFCTASALFQTGLNLKPA
jgi:hypothetical protein